MARPNKTGLDYYNIDTDILYDRKTRRLIKTFDGRGWLIFFHILTEIYRNNGCFIAWDSDTAFDVSDFLNIPENLVNEVVAYCCAVGLFDKELLASEKILTSSGIQNRWEKISKEANRAISSVAEINPKYCLLSKETKLLGEETPQKREEIPKKEEEMPQTKQKKRKENENNSPPLPPAGGGVESEDFFSIVFEEIKFTMPKTSPYYVISDNGKLNFNENVNFKELVTALKRNKIAAPKIQELVKKCNYGEVGNEIWRILNDIALSNGQIKSPIAFILSRLKK